MKLIITNDEKIFKFVYDDMICQFPSNEMKNYEHFKYLLSKKSSKNGNYNLACFDAGNGIAAYVLYFSGEFLWVDYLAVLKKYHSCGYGSEVLKQLFEMHSDLNGCYFEVEKVDEKKPQTLKRMRFYERLGCKNTNIKYLFPAQNKPFEMELLFKTFKNSLPTKESNLKAIKTVFDYLHSDVKDVEKTFEKIKAGTI